LRAVAFPDAVDVGMRVAHLGRSSVRYELAVFTQDAEDVLAQGWFVHVFVDRATRRPAPLPDRLRAALEKLVIRL
jgi:acyl-CoA thioester hydrolase